MLAENSAPPLYPGQVSAAHRPWANEAIVINTRIPKLALFVAIVDSVVQVLLELGKEDRIVSPAPGSYDLVVI